MLVVIIYYKLWKETHRTLDNGWMMHATHLSQGVDVGPITFGTTSKLGHATLEAKPIYNRHSNESDLRCVRGCDSNR